jgi:hyperosmotically inducible periplasmic protein
LLDSPPPDAGIIRNEKRSDTEQEVAMNRSLSVFLVALGIVGMISLGCSREASQVQAEETRTVPDVVSDAATTASVKIALAFERGVKATDINVDTDRGTVTLNGAVGSEAERQLAVKVAEDVEGVKDVVNRIHVRG